MQHQKHLYAVGIVVLLLALSGLACNISITTNNAQVSIGDASPTAALAQQPPPAEPLPTEAPPEVQPTKSPPPTPTATLVLQPTDPPAEPPPPDEPPPPEGAAQGGETPPNEGEAPPPPSESQPPPAEPQPVEPAPAQPLEVPSLDPRGQGLGHVSTFRQRMTVQFTGEGTDHSATYYYEAEVNTGASAVHMTIRVEGPMASSLPNNQMEAIWIGDKLWLKVGNQPWVPVPESVAQLQFDEQMFSADDFLPYAPQAQRVQPDEPVNGIPSHHYVYNVQDLSLEHGSFTGSGDIYTAINGGYVVRYTMDGTGTFEEYYTGNATIHLVYDVYDVGAPITISPPLLR